MSTPSDALERKVRRLDNDVQAIDEMIVRIEVTQRRHDNRFDEIGSDIGQLRSDVGGLKADVTGLKTDVSGLKTDLSGLTSEVSSLKTDVGSLKTDVAALSTKAHRVLALLER